MDGEFSEESTKEKKVAPLEYFGHPRKKANKMKHRPYWSFWKVVFAGWMIRHPKKMMKIFGVPLGILMIMIYNAVSK